MWNFSNGQCLTELINEDQDGGGQEPVKAVGSKPGEKVAIAKFSNISNLQSFN